MERQKRQIRQGDMRKDQRKAGRHGARLGR